MSREQRLVYGKLVRDRIPEMITARGQIPRTRVLAEQDLFAALIAKLHEEAEEVASAEPEARLGELADVREVLAALTLALGFTEAEVDEAAASKRAARGGFARRLWLDEVLIP
ncbi:phosphoribosyl-ATP pyrophosphohydrolase [Micromonospora echinospora]|uniref:phosphoribosyl-ATP pyrophosphohydrolase n=1 Tax=Micromonospora echinospora TaxID=1877 RepID=UPI003A8C771E